MQGIEVLYWAISIVFCLALVFAILLWCRSWRKEEHEANTRQVQLLAREVRRLREALEVLDHTAASIQTADEQLSGHVESLRDTARDIKRRVVAPVEPAPPSKPKEIIPPVESAVPEQVAINEEDDRYGQARALLQSGTDPVEVARELDLGTAEVQMIARMLNDSDDTA